MSPCHRVSLLPGDGIGPEVTRAARTVVDATGVVLEWEEHLVGQPAIDAGMGSALPDEVLQAIRSTTVTLKGPISTTPSSSFRSPNIGLRRELDLFAQARFVRSFRGLAAPGRNVDLVVIRETTEDLYAGIEYASGTKEATELAAMIMRTGGEVSLAAGFSIKPVSEPAARRAAEFAFGLARAQGRTRVTVAHKATVMRATDGLLLETAREVAAEYPDIAFDDVMVDAVAMQLVRAPASFDVILTLNLYGDILADLAAGLVGGAGLVAGGNYGDGVAMFEPAHGSAPKYAGLDRADPVGAVLSGALMLRHLGETDAASRVEHAVATVIATGKDLTPDLAALAPGAASVGTAAMSRAIVDQL